MKIMYILHESGSSFNGASRSALTLVKAAVENGDSVFVVLPMKKGKIVEELDKIQNVKIIESRFYNWKRRKSDSKIKQFGHMVKYHCLEKIKNNYESTRLAQLALKENIDIIHSNSSVVNIGGLIYKKTGIPHVWHVREFGEEDFSMYPFESNRYFYGFMYKNATKIVCVSNAIQRKLKGNMPENKLCVVYNGVDIPDKNQGEHIAGNLLIAGMISKNKGQWIAVEAVDILRKRGVDVRLFIAGKGNTENLGSFFENNKDRIELLGFVNDMEKIREVMDIELMCSVSEGFGRTLVEGMASRLIVIASNRGSAPEIVKEGINGFLFESNNPKSLADIIEKVLKKQNIEKEQIRNQAYNDAIDRFSKNVYINNIRNIYQLLEEEYNES